MQSKKGTLRQHYVAVVLVQCEKAEPAYPWVSFAATLQESYVKGASVGGRGSKRGWYRRELNKRKKKRHG